MKREINLHLSFMTYFYSNYKKKKMKELHLIFLEFNGILTEEEKKKILIKNI